MCPADWKLARTPGATSTGASKGTARKLARIASASRSVKSESAGLCFENPLRLAKAASSSCRRPLSGNTIRQSSSERRVATTIPRKPSRPSTGR